jgi:NAD(P)-dependent dehydrogenase (short-subunit alcohol dehydrogenase family)
MSDPVSEIPSVSPSAPSFSLAGRTALVSGGSRGLGKGFAVTLARAGADVAVTSRTIESLEDTVRLVEALGRKCVPVVLDVRSAESIREAALAAKEGLGGRLDVLVNNAGCNVRKPAVDVTWDDWNLILDTNLRGTFFLAQAVARDAMIPQGYGRIINIGSVTCQSGYAGLTPYGASRGGVMQMTKSLAHDWGAHGITVNCLAPGWFKTQQNRVMYENGEWIDYLCERIPLGRPGAPGDLDGALTFLASDASAYITGQTMFVDGGITVGAVRALPPKS